MVKHKPKTLANALRYKIETCGLSANQLADLCGVPQQRISEFLNGGDIRGATAHKLMEFFELEPADRLVMAVLHCDRDLQILAKEIDVSFATLLRSLQGRESLSPEARQRLRKAVGMKREVPPISML